MTTALAANLEYISRGKQSAVECTTAMRRPWLEMLDPQSLSRPGSVGECFTRLRRNLSYFRVNMAMVVLLGVFLSLLWHPISLLVMVASMAAWLSLFFLAEQPIMLLGRPLDDRIVLFLLATLTLIFLLLTSPAFNVIISVNVCFALLVLYSVFHRTDHLFLGEDAADLLHRPPQPHPPSLV